MSEYDFGRKYAEAGPLASRIIDNFYDGVRHLTTEVTGSIETACEVGCGEGYSTARLRRILPERVRLEASDVDPDLVAIARGRNPTVPITRASVYELESPDNTYDLVYCMEVLEHLERPDDALAELCRVSRRHLILTVPREPLWRALNLSRGAHWSRLGNTPGHIGHWSKRGFIRWVGTRGHVRTVRTPVPWTQVLVDLD
jgi:2-polyprenyl-3-methyl-5-hydroxy-6-metoxy-1,4-benzoquinol methylase